MWRFCGAKSMFVVCYSALKEYESNDFENKNNNINKTIFLFIKTAPRCMLSALLCSLQSIW